MQLEKFNTEKKFTSLFLVDEINKFRKLEGNRAVLRHDDFLRKIEKDYKSEIRARNISVSQYTYKTPTGGDKQAKMYELTYKQATVMIAGESVTVRKMIVDVLEAQQKRIQELERKNQPSWIQERSSGKEVRQIETDAIREFVHYALDSGSKNADKYYMLYTKMTNNALIELGHIDDNVKENVKEHLGIMGLTHAKLIEMRIAETIDYGMRESMHYKEIFQFTKEQVNNLVNSMSFNPKKSLLNS